jgi:hypothetical protein
MILDQALATSSPPMYKVVFQPPYHPPPFSVTAIRKAQKPQSLLPRIKPSFKLGAVSRISFFVPFKLTDAEYGDTDDAKAAGGEALDDLNGGNSHRLRVRSELQEAHVAKLEDTYDDRRFRRGLPVSGMGRGAAAASANDRGHFRARGGGFAGRGPSRASTGQSR